MRLWIVCEKKGGRKKASFTQPALVEKLEALAGKYTAGSAVEPGRVWTGRSPNRFAEKLTELGYPVSRNTVKNLLRDELGLSRRKMDKRKSMGESPDRHAQFERERCIHDVLTQPQAVVFDRRCGLQDQPSREPSLVSSM